MYYLSADPGFDLTCRLGGSILNESPKINQQIKIQTQPIPIVLWQIPSLAHPTLTTSPGWVPTKGYAGAVVQILHVCRGQN